MMPTYVRHLRAGLVVPNTPAKVVKDDGPILMFDGNRGYGRAVAGEMMSAAIARCRQTGVTVATLANAHHIGRVGVYGELATAAGLVSLHFVNVTDHRALVAPFRGGDARFSTNPVCIAPAAHRAPARRAPRHGHQRGGHGQGPGGEATRASPPPRAPSSTPQGQPTRDPNVMYSEPPGAMLPFGGHKGYALAVVAELLAGALSGGPTIQPGNARHGRHHQQHVRGAGRPRAPGRRGLAPPGDRRLRGLREGARRPPIPPRPCWCRAIRSGSRAPSACATASTWTPPPGRSCSRRVRRWDSRARSPPPTSPEVSPTPSAADELPLAGYTVLDLTRVLAGPYCTRLLCDLGARVIKIERPGDGDETRRNYLQLEPGRADQSSYFHRVNAGKESVAVDMVTARGARGHPRSRAARGRLRGELHARGGRPARLRREDPARAQARPRLLLHLRLRPDRALARAARLRPHHQRAVRPHAPRAGRRGGAARLEPPGRRRARRHPCRRRHHGRAPPPRRAPARGALSRRVHAGGARRRRQRHLCRGPQRRRRSTATRARAWWWPPSATGASPCSSWARPSSGRACSA